MPESRTYYDVLGVGKNASTEEIISMHRKLAKKYHADANSTDPELQKWSHNMMSELNEAYSVLRDSAKRRDYDESLNSNTSNGSHSSEYDPEIIHIENWEHGRAILLEGAENIDLGAPTQELEEACRKQLKKNVKRKIRRYLRLGVPNSYSGEDLRAGLNNAIDEAVITVQENTIRDRIGSIYMFIVVILSLIFEFRFDADGFWSHVGNFGLHLFQGAAAFFVFSFLAKFIAHGLSRNLIGLAGVITNATVAILILIPTAIGVFSDDLYLEDRLSEIQSPDGSFYISFPSQPAFYERTGEDFPFIYDGDDVKILAIGNEEIQYSIAWVDDPIRDIDRSIEIVTNERRLQDGFRIMSKDQLAQNIHLVNFMNNEGAKYFNKFLFINDTFYHISINTTRKNFEAKHADKFFNSFKTN